MVEIVHALEPPPVKGHTGDTHTHTHTSPSSAPDNPLRVRIDGVSLTEHRMGWLGVWGPCHMKAVLPLSSRSHIPGGAQGRSPCQKCSGTQAHPEQRPCFFPCLKWQKLPSCLNYFLSQAHIVTVFQVKCISAFPPLY